MAWYPGAQKLELQPESDAQPAIRPTQLIFHSIVGPWTPRRTYEYWKNSTNLESHFGVGYDGDIAQYIGTQTRADANYQANRRSDGTGAVSVETASNTSASDPWTARQVETLIRLGVWMHEHHRLPLRICRWASDPGYGYHRLHPQWAAGGGTACPGPARVRQFHDVVFPGIVARATGKTTAPQEDDDMPQYVSLTRPQNFTLEPGVEDAIEFTREYADERDDHYMPGGSQFIHGPALYQGTAYLQLTGVDEGAQIQVRVSEVDRDSREYVGNGGRGEYRGTDGTTFVAYPFTDTTPKGEGVRLRIKHFSSGPVTVKHAMLKALVWPR